MSLRAIEAALKEYLHETTYCERMASQLEAALAMAAARAMHSQNAQHAKHVLEAEVCLWSQLCAEGKAWRGLVSDGLSRVEKAIDHEREAAGLRLEQVHVGLAFLRACYGAQSLLDPDEAVHTQLSAFCSALIALVHVVIAQQMAAESALPGVTPAPRSASALKEQDALMPSLAVLGCGEVLSNLRRQPLNALLAAVEEAERCIKPQPASLDEATLLLEARACAAAPAVGVPLHTVKLATRICARHWDKCHELLTNQKSSLGTEPKVIESLLRLMQWWRPLVLGLPSPPSWYRRKQAERGGGVDEAELLEAAASHMQALWRSKLAKEEAARTVVRNAEPFLDAGADDSSTLQGQVMLARAAFMRDRGICGVNALLDAVQPVRYLKAFERVQHRVGLQLSTLTLALCSPLSTSNHSRLPMPSPTAEEQSLLPKGRAAADGCSLSAASSARQAKPASASTVTRIEQYSTVDQASMARARASPSSITRCTDDARTTDVSSVHATAEPNLLPSSFTSKATLPLAKSANNSKSPMPPMQPSCTALDDFGPRSEVTMAPDTTSGSNNGAARVIPADQPSKPQAEAMAVASATRVAAEDSEAATWRADYFEQGGFTGAETCAAEWWASRFGLSGGDTVPFERLRIAAEAEIGNLSSVDIQLLRLELSDDRGRLTKTALTRLLAGSIDGSSGYPTVRAAFRALLQSARAQLDRQVEVRMKQAASHRTGNKQEAGSRAGAAINSTPRSRTSMPQALSSRIAAAASPAACTTVPRGPVFSPVEHRVRLEMADLE